MKKRYVGVLAFVFCACSGSSGSSSSSSGSTATSTSTTAASSSTSTGSSASSTASSTASSSTGTSSSSTTVGTGGSSTTGISGSSTTGTSGSSTTGTSGSSTTAGTSGSSTTGTSGSSTAGTSGSSGGSTTGGTNSLSGAQAFDVNFAYSSANAFPDGGLDFSQVQVFAANLSATCPVFQALINSPVPPANVNAMILELENPSGQPVATGTYPFVAPEDSPPTDGGSAAMDLLETGPDAGIIGEQAGAAGTINVTEVDASGFKGTFSVGLIDMNGDDAGSLTGSLGDAPYCQFSTE